MITGLIADPSLFVLAAQRLKFQEINTLKEDFLS